MQTRMDAFPRRHERMNQGDCPLYLSMTAYPLTQEYSWHLVSHLEEGNEQHERHLDEAEDQADDFFWERDVRRLPRTHAFPTRCGLSSTLCGALRRISMASSMCMSGWGSRRTHANLPNTTSYEHERSCRHDGMDDGDRDRAWSASRSPSQRVAALGPCLTSTTNRSERTQHDRPSCRRTTQGNRREYTLIT